MSMVWLRLTRPFTLFPPLLGMLSGAAAAIGAGVVVIPHAQAWLYVILGALMASALNAASNVLNQVCDLELDRINKPERPLPRGEIPIAAARTFALALYALSVALAFVIIPARWPELGIIVALTAFLTWAYSAPPLRLRSSWWLAPLVIAIPRGWLLKVAGWATLAPVTGDAEPWILGGLFFLFILGCAPTKDFSDMEGDRRGGCDSLPLHFGPRRAALMMAPFYVLPWLLLILLALVPVGDAPLLSIAPPWAIGIGALLTLHGALTAIHLVRHAEDMDGPPGQRAWRNLYCLMMEAQVGVGLAYLL